MDFTFNEEQLSFRNAVRSFFMNEINPELIRKLWETKNGRCAKTWHMLGQQGLTALSVPAISGGLELADTYWMRIGEEVGYFALPEPLMETAYVGVMLLKSLDNQSKVNDLLTQIAEGKVRLAIEHPINPLTGDAHLADYALAWDNDDLYLVPKAAISCQDVKSIDPSRRASIMTWDKAQSTLLQANCPELKRDMLNRAAFACAAQLSGLTKRLLDLAIDYTAERKQFGKPIGSFQAVKHLLANVAVQLEYMRPVIARAANSLEINHPNRDWHVSHAKLMASRTANQAARQSIQVHGAMGYTWEMDVQIFAKRAWSLDAIWGDEIFHQDRCNDYVLNAPSSELEPGNTFN